MEFLIKALRAMIPTVDLYDSGAEEIATPYVTYEYNSVTFENQYQVLFSMDIVSNSAYEAETIASN
ncbi:MAG: hypothetical protein GY804_05185, partial [Alphaproteobacteria bacterium]|nr:hypothetical protein [Alphaproteobacteria bacterium]